MTAYRAPQLPPAKGYGVIVADPPWEFKTRTPDGGNRAAAKHYPTMPTPKILALGARLGLVDTTGNPIVGLCARHCALVLWGTWPMARDAFATLDAWGFTYKAGGGATKRTRGGGIAFGTGYIYRGADEFWLLGTRGSPKVLSRRERNHIDWLRGAHSAKPAEILAMHERLFAGPYLELFSRHTRPNWDSWGNETGKFDGR